MLVLLFVALWFILRGNFTYVLPCVILFLCVFSPFSIGITSLGEESAFRTFVQFALLWFCLFPFPLGVWEGLRFVIVALPGLFSYLFLLSPLTGKVQGRPNTNYVLPNGILCLYRGSSLEFNLYLTLKFSIPIQAIYKHYTIYCTENNSFWYFGSFSLM